MFGLYMLAIYLGIAIIAAGFVALLVIVALAVGLVTHPIRTLALVFHKLSALAAGLALILIDLLVLDRSRQAGLHPVLLGLHRRDRRFHNHPCPGRVGARTANQSRTPRCETDRRAVLRRNDDVLAGVGRGGYGP